MIRPEPRWLGRLAVDEAHFRQVREHGGAYGIRDEAALEAALARPRQRWHYDEDATIFDLAAAYTFGLVRGHPYLDGNKRIGLVVLVAFLDRNGCTLVATNADAASVIIEVAAGERSESELAAWVAAHSEAQEISSPPA